MGAEDDPLLSKHRVSPRTPSSPVARTPSISNQEYAQTVATRVVYSRGYGAFYVSLLVASITELLWVLHPWASGGCCRLAYPTSPVFFVVESYLTIGLVGDTVLRMVWQREAFWTQCGNVFDVSVSALSIVCFAVYMADSAPIGGSNPSSDSQGHAWSAAHAFGPHVGTVDQELEVVFLSLMVVWVALRLARLAAVAKNLHSQRRFHATQAGALDVSFSEEEEEGTPSPGRGRTMSP
jgi:hypothetical protein